MRSLSIFGTSSDAGKSTISFALTYLLHHKGFKVAPFKAQNVSNNAVACDEGGEIAQAQHFAASSISLPTQSDFNPVLLKSGTKNHAALIINGKQEAQKSVQDYYKDLNQLKPIVKSAYERLLNNFDMIVAEGAGSPVELNLMDKDLSNIYIADTFNTKIILVADIERGGVFASIWGVYNLLPEKLKNNVIGVIINKFRGDQSLFDEGRTIIQERFGIKVLGVVDYRPFNLGFEDSQSLINYTQENHDPKISVAVIKLPHMSNFTDFEPLIADSEVALCFIDDFTKLNQFDLIILPGTKRTIHDLLWLKSRDFSQNFMDFRGATVAICGGYQMMFETLSDPFGLEHKAGSREKGFAKISGEVSFNKEKIVQKKQYKIFNITLEGYEIHNGFHQTLYTELPQFYGTFVHGIFDSNDFRKKVFSSINEDYQGFDFQTYKEKSIKSYAKHIEDAIDLDNIIKALHDE